MFPWSLPDDSFRLLEVMKLFVTRFNTLSFPLISMNLSTVVELQR
jgi:hypothetical protein